MENNLFQKIDTGEFCENIEMFDRACYTFMRVIHLY